MHIGPLTILIWLLNFGISIWNAYAVGLAWVETKHRGGWPRATAWAGAVMSACGFSWCYLFILVYAAFQLSWLDEDHVGVALQMGYLALIPGILASGMVITLDSWARTYRRRTIGNIGRTAWNTYAQIHNTYNAIGDIDTAFGSVVDSFKGSSSGSSEKKDGAVAFIVLFLVVILALVSGILTTAVIISRVAGNDELTEQAESGSTKSAE